MKNSNIEGIIENLFLVLPVIHKRLLKIDVLNAYGGTQLSRLHLAVMGILSKDRLPISEIARKLLIPRPQMTRLINQLINAGIVEKQPDTRDRRVINIEITDNGRVVLNECTELLKKNIREKLSSLSEKDIDEMSLHLEKLKEIWSRLE